MHPGAAELPPLSNRIEKTSLAMRKNLRTLCACIALFATSAAGAQTPPAAAPLRLYVFECGSIDVSDVSVFSPGVGKGEHKVLTDSCYLVVHPKGTLMWDTGFSDAQAALPDGQQVS